MTGIGAWFGQRSLRERRLILAMLALLAVTILWAGLILPVRDGLSSSRERYAAAVVRVGATESRLDALGNARANRAPALGAPLADAVRASAEQAGFTLATLDPSGDSVRASIANARPAALFAWIATLERAGILADTVTVTNNGDQTVAAQLTLRVRGA